MSHRIQLMRTDGPQDEFLYDCIRPYARTLLEPASQSRRITGPLVPSHISYTRIDNNHCPSPLQDMQVEEVNEEEEVNPQLDDTHKRTCWKCIYLIELYILNFLIRPPLYVACTTSVTSSLFIYMPGPLMHLELCHRVLSCIITSSV